MSRLYICLEGIDGCGKSTIHKLLRKEFKEAEFVREPGTTKFAEDIRSVVLNNYKEIKNPITIQLALLAARSDLNINSPFIISDRCFMSASYCDVLQDEESIRIWFAFTLQYVKIPNNIIYLDINPETAIERIKNRTLDGFESLNKEHIQKRIDAYRLWFKVLKETYPSISIYNVDANRSIQEVLNDVIAIIKEKSSCEKPEI